MSELLSRLKNSGSISIAETLTDSVFFNKKDMIQTHIPSLNVALSGDLNGGLTPGLTVIAGLSKTFKTCIALTMISSYLEKYEEGICLFFDSEFGASPQYMKSMNVDTDRVIHIPIEHIEQLKFDIVKRLEAIKKGDKVIILIDSLGNLASKKEIEDAIEERSVADMTRAKAIRSLFRIITPHLIIKDIPCLCVNHIYQEMGLYPKSIVGGGTSVMYSANTVWIISKAQEKDGAETVGFIFTLNVEKSRFVKEKSKIPLKVMFDGGLSKYSGLLDLSLESGHVIKPKNGWYQKKDNQEKNYREKETENMEFWESILKDESFDEFIKKKFQIG